MNTLKRLTSSLWKRIETAAGPQQTARVARRYAQVHDVRIERAGRSKSLEQIFGEGQNRKESGKVEEYGFPWEKPSMEKNVLNTPLTLHSTRPLTGFLRTGYCEAPPSDAGNHSIAGILTTEFLDFSAARGNDLRAAGLSDGCKWCLCVSRWKEAFNARKGDADRVVPRVVLGATNVRALEGVALGDLRKCAVDGGNEGSGGKGAQ